MSEYLKTIEREIAQSEKDALIAELSLALLLTNLALEGFMRMSIFSDSKPAPTLDGLPPTNRALLKKCQQFVEAEQAQLKGMTWRLSSSDS